MFNEILTVFLIQPLGMSMGFKQNFKWRRNIRRSYYFRWRISGGGEIPDGGISVGGVSGGGISVGGISDRGSVGGGMLGGGMSGEGISVEEFRAEEF